MPDQIDALERLARLHQSGALTDAEFAEQKRRVLREGDPVEARVTPVGAVYDDPGSRKSSIGVLLGALCVAVLLGVLLWWQMVDDKGLVKPVPTPGTAAASAPKAEPEPAASANPEAPASAQPAPTVAATHEPDAIPAGKNAVATFKPSFRCTGQTDAVLVMICTDRALSSQDRILSERFRAVLRTLDPGEQQDVLRQQRGFLRERAACADEQCLGEWYDRVNALYE